MSPFPPRKWQSEALSQHWRDWERGIGDNYLAYVVPSGGKTYFACEDFKQFAARDVVRHLVVVVHTTGLRAQWRDDAALHGIHLRDKPGEGDGCVVMYHQLAGMRAGLQDIRSWSMVVFDENHHMSDKQSWGRDAEKAFARFKLRLSLSGTPFRDDDGRIPFIKYNGSQAVADVTYGYREAFKDGVVPAVFFTSIGAKASWRSDGDRVTVEADQGTLVEQSRRLNLALHDRAWRRECLSRADTKLQELRKVQANAAGLACCVDQAHARKVVKDLQWLGHKPTLIISDVKDAASALEGFRESEDPWAVTVRMVTEGVTIRRCRVGAYLTNYRTELFMRQFIGRLTRTLDGYEDQSAFVFLPDHPTLLEYAMSLDEDRLHVLREKAAGRAGLAVNGSSEPLEGLRLQVGDSRTIGIGGEITAELFEKARAIQAMGMGSVPVEVIAQTLQLASMV